MGECGGWTSTSLGQPDQLVSNIAEAMLLTMGEKMIEALTRLALAISWFKCSSGHAANCDRQDDRGYDEA